MKKPLIYKITILAVFIALVFVGTSIHIQTGISKIHLGNFFCILAALLCGPQVGGLAGAIGMGLNDILIGSYGPDTFIRTIIVKYIMGFIVGYLFKKLIKEKQNPKTNLISITSVLSIIFIIFLVLFIKYEGNFKLGDYTFKNSLFLIICLGIISLLFIVFTILSTRLKKLSQYVLLATSVGLLINVILEFIIKIPFKVAFAGLTFEQSFIYAVTSLPSAILTTCITIFIIISIYTPVYFATKKFNKLNTIYKEIEELEES